MRFNETNNWVFSRAIIGKHVQNHWTVDEVSLWAPTFSSPYRVGVICHWPGGTVSDLKRNSRVRGHAKNSKCRPSTCSGRKMTKKRQGTIPRDKKLISVRSGKSWRKFDSRRAAAGNYATERCRAAGVKNSRPNLDGRPLPTNVPKKHCARSRTGNYWTNPSPFERLTGRVYCERYFSRWVSNSVRVRKQILLADLRSGLIAFANFVGFT